MGINGHVGSNGAMTAVLKADSALLIRDARLLRRNFGQIRLELWSKWLSADGAWSRDHFWDRVLDAAVSIGSADYANVQLVHRRLRGLELTAQRGFHRPFLEFFRFVNDDHSACGAALLRRRPVIVADVTNSPIFACTPQLEVLLDAGVRAVKSFPLVGASGQLLGMMSVHYRDAEANGHGKTTDLKVLARATGLAMETRLG